jgi:hypothetical protein
MGCGGGRVGIVDTPKDAQVVVGRRCTKEGFVWGDEVS